MNLIVEVTPHGIVEISERKIGGSVPKSFAPQQIIQNAKLANLNAPYHWAIAQLKILAEMSEDRIAAGGSLEFVPKEARRIMDGMIKSWKEIDGE